MPLWVCKTCGEEKDRDDFPTNGSKHCRPCTNKISSERYHSDKAAKLENSKLYYENNKHRVLDSALFRNRLVRYGVTRERFHEMLSEQNDKCAICYTGIDISACVDHCHHTMKVRRLLCKACNIGLGLFKDNTDNLKQAIKYLDNEEDIRRLLG